MIMLFAMGGLLWAVGEQTFQDSRVVIVGLVLLAAVILTALMASNKGLKLRIKTWFSADVTQIQKPAATSVLDEAEISDHSKAGNVTGWQGVGQPPGDLIVARKLKVSGGSEVGDLSGKSK